MGAGLVDELAGPPDSGIELGRVGVFSLGFAHAPLAAARDALLRIEDLGYGAAWCPETAASREAMSNAALLLGWTERIVVATGIANIYARDATASANGWRGLTEAYPGRFLLGLGVGHSPSITTRGGSYGPPVPTMRRYLDLLDASTYEPPGRAQVPRVIAALGPLMLRLARERGLGAHPYFIPPAHTSFARELLGPGRLLAPEQAVVLERDPQRARKIARAHTRAYLGADNYRNNLLRLGYDEAELVSGGSDRVVDDIVAWGDADSIRARVSAHFEAGADHVCVQVLGEERNAFELDALATLAPVLLDR